MSSFVKFNAFVEAVAQKKVNLNADTLKVVLCLTAPVATNSVYADLTEIANGNGYTTGGTTSTGNTAVQTAGVLKLVSGDVVFTASVGSIANFRYAVLYDFTATNKDLIGFWDYGATVTTTVGNTFTVDFDGTNGVLTIT